MLNSENQPTTQQPIPDKPTHDCWHCGQAFDYTLTDDLEKAHSSAKVLGYRPAVFWTRVAHELCDKKADLEKEMQAQRERVTFREQWRKITLNGPFLPDTVEQKTFENFQPCAEDQQNIELVKSWQASDEFGVFFMGSPGSGKTHLMLALFNRAINDEWFLDNRNHAVWFPVALGLDRIRSEMQKDEDKFKKSALSSSYLFLDDLGVENPTEWGREQLYIILDYRLSQHLPTFISTNMTVDEVRTRYHERFLSRIKENSLVVQLKGTDHRTSKMKDIVSILKGRVKP